MTGGNGGELGGGVRSAEGGAGRVPTVDRFPGLHLPDWFQTLGRGAWLLVGIAAERPRSQDSHEASTSPTLADQFGEGGPPARP
jgi:hypothetical protein